MNNVALTGFPDKAGITMANNFIEKLQQATKESQRLALEQQALKEATPSKLTGSIGDRPKRASGFIDKDGQLVSDKPVSTSETTTTSGSTPLDVNDVVKSLIKVGLNASTPVFPMGSALANLDKVEQAANYYFPTNYVNSVPDTIKNAYLNEYGTNLPNATAKSLLDNPEYLNRVLTNLSASQPSAVDTTSPQSLPQNSVQPELAPEVVPAETTPLELTPLYKPQDEAYISQTNLSQVTPSVTKEPYSDLIKSIQENLSSGTALSNKQLAQLDVIDKEREQEKLSREMSPGDYASLGLRNVIRTLFLQPTLTKDIFLQEKYAPRTAAVQQEGQARQQSLAEARAIALAANNLNSSNLSNLSTAESLKANQQLEPLKLIQLQAQEAIASAFSPEEQAEIYREGKLSEDQIAKIAPALEQAKLDAQRAQEAYNLARGAYYSNKAETPPKEDEMASTLKLIALTNPEYMARYRELMAQEQPAVTNSTPTGGLLNPPASK